MALADRRLPAQYLPRAGIRPSPDQALLFVNAVKEDSLQQGALLDLARYLRRAWRLPQGGEVGVVH